MKIKKKILNKKYEIIGFKEFRENAEKYISLIEKGRSFTVFKRSRPIFKLVPVDEYDDDDGWESIVDFTKINPNGVPIKDVIKALRKRANGQD